MNDWYDKDYYKHSPSDNPTGLQMGTEKVLRGTLAMGADNLMRACKLFCVSSIFYK